MSRAPLLIATQNLGKFGEFRDFLREDFSCMQPERGLEVTEDGTSYYENALKKAMAYCRAFGQPVLSDDSGLEVQALGGKPGLHTARFGGEGLTWPQRWQALLEAVRATGSSDRDAQFVCVLCYYDGRGVPRFFEGKASGRITDSPEGESGFGYDPIFHSNLLGKTFGEATPEEKHRFSHRAEALRAFLTWWKSTRG